MTKKWTHLYTPWASLWIAGVSFLLLRIYLKKTPTKQKTKTNKLPLNGLNYTFSKIPQCLPKSTGATQGCSWMLCLCVLAALGFPSCLMSICLWKPNSKLSCDPAPHEQLSVPVVFGKHTDFSVPWKEMGRKAKLFFFLLFFCRHGRFHGHRPEKNSDWRTSCCSELPTHPQPSKAPSDVVQRRAQDYTKQQNVSQFKAQNTPTLKYD